MASLTTDTSLTQQATALAKEFGLQLMTPASVTVEELKQLLIDQLEKVKALCESNPASQHRHHFLAFELDCSIIKRDVEILETV